jgi:mRNA deadenylase 3'-5' endonuclease subunit Ccr4
MLTLLTDSIPQSKRHHLAKWIKKENLTVCCLQEIHLIHRNKYWLRVKGWKKIYQYNAPPQDRKK